MSQSGHYNYYEADDFQAISLPYGTGRISMYIFLPASTYSIHEFQKSINAKAWGNWLDGFGEAEGEVMIPRLKIEYGGDLLTGLIALGGNEIAGDDLAGIGAGPLQISSVMHKAIVEVNEEGTEAAAVTAVMLGRGVSRPSKRFTLIADRPFFMAIRDNGTGAVLFTGIIWNPTQS